MTRQEAEQLKSLDELMFTIVKFSFFIAFVSLAILTLVSFFKSPIAYEPVWLKLIICIIQAFTIYMVVFIPATIYLLVKADKVHYSFDGTLNPLNMVSVHDTCSGAFVYTYKEKNIVKESTASKISLDKDSYYIEPEHLIVYRVFGNYYKTTYKKNKAGITCFLSEW
ncbi:hypothetical protein [Hungatella hathewayi]|uniref:hypothetical protein n=1 Tax=Hungatella hathewayi TaxID=154046 RepID=UPI0035633AF2